ncbi:MAG: hypothetical protein AB8F74_15080 [Saprospiraceae bacterium]
MKKLRLLLFFLITFLVSTIGNAQNNVSFHFGTALPLYDFGSSALDNEDAGGAATGLNAGIQLIYPISDNGFGIFGGIDFNYNALKKGVRNDIEELYESLGIVNAEYNFFEYINIPLTTGVNYSFSTNEKFGLFLEAGLALNLLKVTNFELEVNNQTITQGMDIASNIGVKLSGGVSINRKMKISVTYFGLGEHEIEGEVVSGNNSDPVEGRVSVDLLALSLGVLF